jgi:hypothetical protein
MRGRTLVQHIEIVHHINGLTIWRPGDTEVWATLADGKTEQIGGWSDAKAPWIDSDSGVTTPPPWSWPPPPPT